MKYAKHSYQDLDIAEYVLGLQADNEAAAIQACLAQDNAAAACALKWEAYLLSIVDELEGVAPPAELQARIRATLGHQEPVGAPIVLQDPVQVQASPSRRARAPRLRRGRLAAVGAAVIGLLLLGVVALAMWHSSPPQATEQAVQLAPADAAGRAAR